MFNLNPRAYMRTATQGLKLDQMISFALLCQFFLASSQHNNLKNCNKSESIDKKHLSRLVDFGCSVFRGWRWGSLSESVKKRKFVTKYFFQITLNEVLKTHKKLYRLMQKLIKIRNKMSCNCILQIFIRRTFKN